MWQINIVLYLYCRHGLRLSWLLRRPTKFDIWVLTIPPVTKARSAPTAFTFLTAFSAPIVLGDPGADSWVRRDTRFDFLLTQLSPPWVSKPIALVCKPLILDVVLFPSMPVTDRKKISIVLFHSFTRLTVRRALPWPPNKRFSQVSQSGYADLNNGHFSLQSPTSK